MSSSYAIIWDERYLLHDTGRGHPERADRLRAIQEVLNQHEGQYHQVPSQFAQLQQLERVHRQSHIQSVEKASSQSSYLDGDTPTSEKSWEAALLAAGSCIQLAERILAGEYAQGFAFVRPPGHHAEPTHAMGFCLFNNIAIVAEELVRKHKIKKIAIVDFDVHHGNGTQHFFYDREDVFYISTHQYPFYPGTGAASEIGQGAGKNYTLNVPMLAGAGDAEYLVAFQNKIIPAILQYQPEIILVSAGFDAHELDPLANINLTQKGFSNIAKQINEVAFKVCQGKQVYLLEGGYALEGLKQGVGAILSVWEK